MCKTGQITNSGSDNLAEPLLQSLGWKSVKELTANYTAVTMCKSMHNLMYAYMNEKFVHSSDATMWYQMIRVSGYALQ